MVVKVLICGDSTAAGFVPAKNGAPSYTTTSTPSAVAESILNARQGCMTAQLENVAVGGSNFGQWLDGGMVGGIQIIPLSQRLAGTDAKVIVMQLGINDAFIAGITVETYMAQIERFRNAVLSSGKTPIFMTDNPISYSSTHNGILWSLMNGVRVKAGELGMQIVDCNDAIARHVDNWPQFMADSIHPDETLYRFMGSLLATALARHIV